MNCNEVQGIVTDLARDQMMDVGAREKALAHARQCPGCAVLIEDARSLTAGLRRLSSETIRESAPGTVEALLLSAFRHKHRDSVPAIEPAKPKTSRWVYIGAGVAAAAVIVILISLIVASNRRGTNETNSHAKQGQQETPKSAPQDKPESPAVTAVAPSQKDEKSVERKAPKNRGSVDRRHDIARHTVPNASPNQGDGEIATDFFPLMNPASISEIDSGQLVRVELPRSALMRFGLPINMDRANDPIKADVVVGQDGLARAIRFVR